MKDNKGAPQVQQWAKFLKRKLIYSKLLGIMYCAICALSMVGLYFEFLNDYMCMIMIFFSMAAIFVANASIQGIRRGQKMQIWNIVGAVVCFAAVIVFVTLGFIKGEIAFVF